jgi:hypothetical protein
MGKTLTMVGSILVYPLNSGFIDLPVAFISERQISDSSVESPFVSASYEVFDS